MSLARPQSFARPMAVYMEMYSEEYAPTPHYHSWSVWTALFFCVVVLSAVAWGLHMGEMALSNRLNMSAYAPRAEDPVERDRALHFSTIARWVFGVETAHAAPLKGYDAQITRQSSTTVTLEEGETTTLTVRIKNSGSREWTRSGKQYVSVYTQNPKYRKSPFATEQWIDATHPVRIKEDRVDPGAFATLSIPLTAATKPGTYTETYQIAAEDTAWIPGGVFTVRITVVSKSAKKKSTPEAVAPASPVQDPVPSVPAVVYKAIRLIQSHRVVEAPGGQDVLFRVGFKNTGETPWVTREIRNSETAVAAVGVSSKFAHTSWLGSDRVLKLATGVVNPGSLDMYEFTFRTPAKAGTYTAQFQLYVADTQVEGGAFAIPVTVTQDAPLVEAPVQFIGQEQLAPEPRIRVGLFKIENTVQVRSPFPYRIVSADQTILGELPSNILATLSYSPTSGKYAIEAPGISFIQKEYLRLEPMQEGSYLEVVTHTDRPSWNKSLNFNTFRDTVEIRYAAKNEKTWLINELPIEHYLAGVAETSDYTPVEYQKAIMTAARTYAYTHLMSGAKHADRYFHVDATYDQVYKGYAREKHFPVVASSVHATRGELVLYNGEVVVTPYYSRSDGRTRDWTEVWGGKPKPWLVSVKTQYDAGKKLWGHGVGMSAEDAAARAKVEGIDYKALLQYYYRGTQIEKRFH